MKRCPECRTYSENEDAYCAACFYKYRPVDEARFAAERYHRKCRLCSVAVGLMIAVVHYALAG
jgi:hypothetical protein